MRDDLPECKCHDKDVVDDISTWNIAARKKKPYDRYYRRRLTGVSLWLEAEAGMENCMWVA